MKGNNGAMPEWLREILSKPTVQVPEVARALDIGRNQAYEAVARGDIPAERFGRRLVVPTAWLRRKLQLDEIA